MADPKPVTLTQVDTGAYTGAYSPQPLVIVGSVPGEVTPQAAPTIDVTPADATAVATDLQAVVTALIAAGVFTA